VPYVLSAWQKKEIAHFVQKTGREQKFTVVNFDPVFVISLKRKKMKIK